MASRSTFRDPAGDVAWQRQLRDRFAAEGVPAGVPHLDVKRAVVRPVSRRLAEQIILKYEWLGTMATTGHHFGIFFGAFCAGVTCVALGSGHAGSNAHAMFSIERREFAVLARGACVHWAPLGGNSKLVSWTTRLVGRHTDARVMVAYADEDAGEIGTIYQASGWSYIGRSGAVRQVIAPSGRALDEKFLHDYGKPRGMNKTETLDWLRAHGWRVQMTNPKHRYVCVLDRSDRELVARVESMRQPYPKRAQHRGDAPAVQAGESGSTPTRTLQEITL